MMSKTTKTDYDPSFVFQSHSSDLPLLNDWVSELISLTVESLPVSAHPTTEQLVSALQRYDTILRELLRQMRVHSEPITRIVSKVWAGILKLLDYMIKSYHRYVKHTAHLQDQAQHLMRQRMGEDVAVKMRDEEFELERTVLLGKIRVLESETEFLKSDGKKMKHENARLKSVVSTYIESADLSDGTWGLMETESFQIAAETSTIDDDDGGSSSQKLRQQTENAGIEQLRMLARLDVQIDQALANVLKEEDRQRLLVADLMTLMKNHQDAFGTGRNVKGGWRAGSREVPNPKVNASVQVDRRDFFEVVQGVYPKEAFETFQDQDFSAPDAPSTAKIRGVDVPFQLRKFMQSFPRVVRVPPAGWLCQTIMAIYFAKIREDDELRVKGLCSRSINDFIHDYFLKRLGLESVVDNQIMQLLVACEHYVGRLRLVALFGSQIGMFRKEDAPDMDSRDIDFLLDMFRSFLSQGQLRDSKNSCRPKASSAVTGVVSEEVGEADLIDASLSGVEAAEHLQVSRTSAIVTLQESIARFLPDGGHDYIAKVKALHHSERGVKYIDLDDFIDIAMEPWQIIRGHWEEHARFIFQEHCNVHKVLSEAQFANDTGMKNRDTILMQVQKASASESKRRSVRAVQRQQKDSGGKPATAAQGSKATKGKKQAEVEKEPVCETMTRNIFAACVVIIDPSLTESKIDKMFDEACKWSHEAVLRILEQNWLKCSIEAVEGLDDELEQLRVQAFAEMRYDKFSGAQSGKASVKAGGKSGGKAGAKTSPAMAKMLGLTEEIDEQSEWPKHFYMNLKTSKTQWVQPYNPNVFFSADIELDSFVHIVLKYDLFVRSPLVALMHVAPPDLWPNAQLFLKQLQSAALRAKKLDAPPVIAVMPPSAAERDNSTDNAAARHSKSHSKKSGRTKHRANKGKSEKSEVTEIAMSNAAGEDPGGKDGADAQSDFGSQGSLESLGEGDDWQSVGEVGAAVMEGVVESNR